MASDFSKLAAALKKLRVARGLSQTEVAKKLGYSSPQFISNWERGLASPPVKVLKRLAGLYETEPGQLFNMVVKAAESRMRAEFEKSKGRGR
jgi:transcriptional regulator with XRE-family HTH domain